MKKLPKLPENIELSGPYFKFSCPYGKETTLHRDEWFVSRKLTDEELETASPVSKIFKSSCLGNIICFRDKPKMFVIDQLFPHTSFNTLQKAIDFLIANENKLSFCS